MAKILVIDLGTTSFKFALFDRHGRLCALTHRVPPTRGAEQGRAELSTDDFLQTIEEGVASLGASAGGLADVEAISFATQTNSFLLLDPHDHPLTPLILWPDRRAAELDPTIVWHPTASRATTGVPSLTHQFMLAKLLWLRQNQPRLWEQVGRLCLISDYLTLCLTGRHVTEAGAAGLTALVDIHQGRWWDEMLASAGLDRTWLPEICRATADLGPISGEGATRFGLPAGCRFVVGCLDQYAGAIGTGNIRPYLISETTGTVLSTVRMADDFDPGLPPTAFQGPAHVVGHYWRMAFGETSANYLQWYRDQLPDHLDFDTLSSRAATVDPGADGLRLAARVPEGPPKDVFAGWTNEHTPGHAVRCILETVAEALADQVAVISGSKTPKEIRSAGGAARSPLWLQIKADVLGLPVRATKCPEPTSLGAAMIAEAAIAEADPAEIAESWVQLGRVYEPDPRRHNIYLALRSSRECK